MKVRSKSMQGLISEFDDLNQNLFGGPANGFTLDKGIERIITLGSSIGALHVSCCTITREALYQKLLKSLNNIHIQLWAMKGVSH